MKKLLWTLFILLLLALGFLYIVKNPELPISQKILTTLGIDMTVDEGTGIDLTNCISYFDGCNTCTVASGQVAACTKMYCETPAEPQCLLYEWTGMDLSGCVSYFDGCNNCSVKDGRPDACTMMYCETPSEPKCNAYATGETTSTGESTSTGEITASQNPNESIYTNSKYGLSFAYPKNREINSKEEDNTSDPDCTLKLHVSLMDTSKPLQCYDPGCTPNIQPSLGIDVRNLTRCQWIYTKCTDVDQSLSGICNQLVNAGISEEIAAKTVSFAGANGSDYRVMTGSYGYLLEGSFIDGIIHQTRAFHIQGNGYAVQIFDNQGMYTDVFDDFIKTFNNN